MTEKSYFWADVDLGDGIYSSYNDGEFSDVWRKLFQTDRVTMGVIDDYANELAVTIVGANASMNTGAAMVDGKFYETDAAVLLAIPVPIVATRVDRIVLRKDFIAQTVRAYRVVGEEGAGTPALTQTEGVTWDIPLATVTTTTGGVRTIVDNRTFCVSPLSESLQSSITLIQTIVSDGASPNIDFLAIPATYTNLMILGRARTAGAGTDATMLMRFNNISAIEYNRSYINGTNVGTGAGATAAQNAMYIGPVTAAGGAANHSSSFRIMIPQYAGALYYKTMQSMLINMPTVVAADCDIFQYSGAWLPAVQVAISRITLISGSGNFVAGSVASLYGIL